MSAEPSQHDPPAVRVAAPPRRGRLARGLAASLGLLLALVAGGAVWVRQELLASLPQLQGERPLAGLSAPVRVERDALGVPTVRGASRADVARALGFLHAQDRFFQMDLLRRRAAGELAELFGAVAAKADREIRIHRLRLVARRTLEATRPEERVTIQAYTDGVNAGLAALGGRPFEYLALRAGPRPWQPEDTFLVSLAMFITLHDEKGVRESTLGVMHDVLPEPLFTFLAPTGTEWDAPLQGKPRETPPVPGPEVYDLRQAKSVAGPAGRGEVALDLAEAAAVVGSNNWAVAGRFTANGGALLADDMHLGIAVPNTWYRASLVWPAAGAVENHVTGVTLPGTPAVVVGSNTHVAWGFTNTQGDWSDLVVLEVDARDQESYRTPEGMKKFAHDKEVIHVKGQPDETIDVVSTVWGPIVDRDHRNRPRALRWTAHEPRAVNPGLTRVETAQSLDEALAVANAAGLPPQNFVCADASGRVGWTVGGQIPRRIGFEGRLPTSWADGTRRWDGWLNPDEYPRVVDPASGRIWTANARVVDGEMLAKMGDGGYALGARARQIRDDLLSIDRATPRDLLGVQLDDRAVFLERWRGLLLDLLNPGAVAADARRAEMRKHVEGWGGHASIDSVGYRAVRAFRGTVAERALGAITAACKKADPRFDYVANVWQYEGPLWRLVTERPSHLLDPRYKTWDEALLAAVDATLAELLKAGPLAARTWGERNTARIQHPLSRAVPALARFLDMPGDRLPGDANMPRFQAPSSGASERLVVSPGREAEGYFHMPVGQSGHPLSPFYRNGHEAWVHGEPTPFLPGPTVYTLTLKP